MKIRLVSTFVVTFLTFVVPVQAFSQSIDQILDLCRRGDLVSIQKLPNIKSLVNRADANGLTPLMAAVVFDQPNVVNFLLLQGANPNTKRPFLETALSMASHECLTETVKRLLSANADLHANGDEALAQALYNQCAEVVSLLLDKGANLEAKRDDGGSLDVVLNESTNYSIANLRQSDKSASSSELYQAAWKGDTKKVLSLIAKKGDVDAINPEECWYDPRCLTALDGAASEGHLETAKALVQAGANYNDGEAALTAIGRGHSNVAIYLLGLGARITPKTLNQASNLGLLDVLQFIKNKKFDMQRFVPDLLLQAIVGRQHETLRYLTNEFSADEKSLDAALSFAAALGDRDSILILHHAKVDLSKKLKRLPMINCQVFQNAANNGHVLALNLLCGPESKSSGHCSLADILKHRSGRNLAESKRILKNP